MSSKMYCNRCSKEIKGTKHGKSKVSLSVNDSNHESWQGSLIFDYCIACTDEIEDKLKESL